MKFIYILRDLVGKNKESCILNNFTDVIFAVYDGNFDEIDRIRDIQSVYATEEYIDFFGGAGFGPSMYYYGFFYSA